MRAFECNRCGECCFGEGGITIEGGDIQRIAGFLKISPASFLSDYCEERNGRNYVRSKEGGFCIFHDHKKGCLIHLVKPGPCRLWPFYRALLEDKENWEMAKGACPGINPDCSFEDFVKQANAFNPGPK
ncbi:MAG: YkgJ family cysteine cluster protein [Pseudomonadota bacterium]